MLIKNISINKFFFLIFFSYSAQQLHALVDFKPECGNNNKDDE